MLAVSRIIHAVVSVTIRNHRIRKIHRNRRIRICNDELARAVDHRRLPLLVFYGSESAVREIACLCVSKRKHGHAVLIQIACACHAVNVGVLCRKNGAGRRRTHQHHTRNRQRGKCFFEHMLHLYIV